jgi:hypothetical protein
MRADFRPLPLVESTAEAFCIETSISGGKRETAMIATAGLLGARGFCVVR